MTNVNPKITIGGREFEIPLLAARQNMIIDPIILRLMPIFALISTDNVAGLTKIDEEYYKDFQEVVYVAITRANPQFTRDMFLDMPVTLQEMIGAFPTIAKQTGIFKEQKEPTSGEDLTGNSLTGGV